MNSLFSAIDGGDKVKLAQLIKSFRESNSNLNVAGPIGNSLMFKALTLQNYSLVELLVDCGIDVNLKKLSVHLLVKDAPVPLIAKVIEKGADTNAAENSSFTSLHLAARANRSEVVELLINKGASVNAQNDIGWTPLHSAAHHGNLAAIKALIKHGARTTMADNKGWTPLHVAVAKKYKATLDALTTVEILDEYKEALTAAKMISPLHLAAKNNYLEGIELLLRVLPADFSEKNGWTPLMLAVSSQHLNATEHLLRSGANPNKASTTGVVPLHIGIKAGDLMILRALLDHRAEINKQDDHGFTALHIATIGGKLEVVKFLLDNGARADIGDKNGYTPLHCLAKHDSSTSEEDSLKTTRLRQVLLDSSTLETVNKPANNGWTPVRIAVQEGNEGLVEQLVKSGASLDFTYGKAGTTPIHWAASQGDVAKVTFYVEKGKVSPNVMQKANGWTPLHVAASKGSTEICRFLLSNAADPNQVDRYYRTPLDVAFLNKQGEAVESVLLEFGSKAPKKDKEAYKYHQPNGSAASYGSIFEAIVRGDLEAVKEMVKENSSKLHLKDAWGNTPLHVAIFSKNREIAEELLKYDVDIEARGEGNQTPLHFACRFLGGDAWAVNALFAKGKPDANPLDEEGKTPLYYANRVPSSFNLVTALIGHGGDSELANQIAEKLGEKDADKKIDKRKDRGSKGGRGGRGGRAVRGRVARGAPARGRGARPARTPRAPVAVPEGDWRSEPMDTLDAAASGWAEESSAAASAWADEPPTDSGW